MRARRRLPPFSPEESELELPVIFHKKRKKNLVADDYRAPDRISRIHHFGSMNANANACASTMGSLIAGAGEGCDKEIERSRREERLSLCNEGRANAKVISINLQLIDREIAISTDRGRKTERERERERTGRAISSHGISFLFLMADFTTSMSRERMRDARNLWSPLHAFNLKRNSDLFKSIEKDER